jgi:hypothetical protein
MARVIVSGAGDVGVAAGWDWPQAVKVMMSEHNNEFRNNRIVFLMQKTSQTCQKLTLMV